MSLLITTLSVLIFKVYFVSSYRQMHFTNADVCKPNGETPTIHLGESALLLYLNNGSFEGYERFEEEEVICHVLVKAKKGLGLMVYAEELELRKKKKDSDSEKVECDDYVEFGSKDLVPFVTLERTGRLCSYKPGLTFDEPNGELLIWLRLGSLESPGGRSRLSLVITPYRTREDKYFNKKCRSGDYFIRKKYFCDGRVNCPDDGDNPRDEADHSCATTPAPPTTTSKTPFTVSNGNASTGPGSGSQWDFSFVVIVLISIVGLLVIACGIVCTLKKCQLSPQPRTDHECPDTRRGMLELARRPERSEENTYVVQPPCPRRPTDFSPPSTTTTTATLTGNTTSIRMPKQSPLLNRNVDDSPPPSYSDIFPPDYVPDPDVMRGETQQQSSDNTTV